MLKVVLFALLMAVVFNLQGSESKFFDDGTTWEKGMGWCYHTDAKLFTGDFNGDGLTDMLCHDTNTGYKWVALAEDPGEFSGTTWKANMGWCHHPGSQLFIGDFNGDRRSDMLCHDGDGYKWIALAQGDGSFKQSWKKDMKWCVGADQLFIGDFNGDGRDDMLCHRPSDGHKWIAYARELGFDNTDWEKPMGWCSHPGSQLFIGDFNGDGRSDMLCHDTIGKKWVALADKLGTFIGTSWEASLGWCSHTGSQLLINDFNADGRDDMLCHDSKGSKWIALAKCDGSFTGTNWKKDMGWCTVQNELHVGKFNSDQCADLLCHGKSNGYKWISLNKH